MTSLHTLRVSMAAALVAAGALASFAITTQAKDLSLPYRSYPGFTCHRWNAQNECVDFSYFEGSSIPAYPSHPGPFYPTYPSSNSNNNVTVSVTASEDEVDEDEQLLYRITVRNNSNSSQRVDVRGFLDADTEFVRASDGGDDDEDDEVLWDNLSINARSSRTVTVTVRTDDDLRDGDTLRFRAEAGNDEDDVDVEVDTDSNNDDDDNEDCDDNDCDVTVRVTASDDDVDENDLLTYSIYVRNDDSRDQRVDVRGFLDSDTSFYSISDGGRRDGDEVEWDNILVGRRSSRTLAVTVRVDNGVDDGDTLTFRAEAGDDEDEVDVDVDSDNDNDDDDEDCDDDDCDITVNVTASPTNPNQEEIVTFHIVLRNDDNDRKTVDVRGQLDDDLAFYSASDRGEGSSNDDEVEWDSVSINGDSTRTLSVSARVRSQADNGDSLRFEVDAGDDSDSVTVRVR